MKISVSKYDGIRWAMIICILGFLAGLGVIYWMSLSDYTQGSTAISMGGSITIKTTVTDDLDTGAMNGRMVMTRAQARKTYRDIIDGQLFVPEKPIVKVMVPGDGKDNDYDGQIDEETRNGKDDDGDGEIDEDLKADDETGDVVVAAVMYPDDGIDNDEDGTIDEEFDNGKDDDGDGRLDEDLRLSLGPIPADLILLYGTVKSVKGWKALVKINAGGDESGGSPSRIIGIGETIPGTEPQVTVLDIKDNKITVTAEGYETTILKNVINDTGNPWLLNKSMLGTLGEKDSSWTLKFNREK